MPMTIWSQDIFSKGELSPLMYSRVTVNAYYNGLKTAQNCITYPQGAIGKRFGTLYNATIAGITDYNQAFFQTFQYLNECVYVIIFIPDNILIYLEGILVATVTSTGIAASEIRNIDNTVIDARFRTSTGIFRPKDLVRTPNAANVISGFTATTITLTTPVTAGIVYPVQFTTSGALPTTTPQIRAGRTYFIYTTSTTTAEIYSSAPEAKAGTGKYAIASAGTGTNNAFIQNTWTYANVEFRNYPVYDFNDVNYDAKTFTLGAGTGFNVTLTVSSGGGFFTPAYIGGSYQAEGGTARIISYTSATVVNVNIVEPFTTTANIPGSLSLVREPAWSDVRGWPAKCSSFQNRSCFANTTLLPNGLWLSVINDYEDFNDIEEGDDNAISWYPSSDNVNYIRFIVPYRSLTIHTNTGIYSTPLSFEQAVTQTNFSMTLQDSTPATAIQPRGIDNQIIILSGNDVHSMLWDGFNNSYTSNIASIANEHLIRNPHDEAAYVDLNKAGSRYMFIINDDGTLVIYQTLISEDVSGFSPARLQQSYGNAYFRWVASSSDGRAWFLTERQLASEGDTFPIDGFTIDTLYSAIVFSLLDHTDFLLLDGTNFLLLENEQIFEPGVPTPFKFTTTDELPLSIPQVETDRFYWAVGQADFFFKVYLNHADAILGVNWINFYSAGIGASVTPWVLNTVFMLEELSFDVKTDCTYVYRGAPENTFTGLPRFDAQEVKINGDGFGFEYTGDDSTIKTEAHGQLVDVVVAAIGYSIPTIIEPLQVSPPGALGPKSSSLLFPQHVRVAAFTFVDTEGGFINGTPIAMLPLNEVVPGVPSGPVDGSFEMSFMLGWNEVQKDGIIITHDDPFDIKLTGIFYKIES